MRLFLPLLLLFATRTATTTFAFVVTRTTTYSSSSTFVGSPLSVATHEERRRRPSTTNIHEEFRARYPLRSTATPQDDSSSSSSSTPSFVYRDSAYFSLEEQSLEDWLKFSAAVAAVMSFDAWLWVLPFGPHGGDQFLQLVEKITGTTSPDVNVFIMLVIFAIFHSGLAGLRTYAEPYVGARTWRVIFAVISLPLALSCISYFVNHAHDGVQLWDLTHVPGLHAALWVTNFISFLFLYPSTFNLLQVAAIEKPELNLWENGIMRITRHPQAIGQILWCVAHTAWLGSSTALAASSVLVAHHLFSIPHGDRRLAYRHGEAFEYLKSKTSVVPFQAVLEGRQELPGDYYKEFLRLPYFVVIGGTLAAYFAHPYMQAGAALLHW